MKTVESGERVKYIEKSLSRETRLMKRIAKTLQNDEKAIQLASYEGQILSTLVKMSGALNVVEIGTLYGYSAAWILEGLPRRGKLWTVESQKDNFDKATEFLKDHDKANQVEVIQSTGLNFLENWPKDKAIDFLFIDADKGNYLNYLNLAKPHLKKGSVVVGDNTFLFGYALSKNPPENYSKNTWRNMREFNEVLSGKTGEFEGMMIPTLQGLSVGVKI